jgi:hypothetical protein
MQILHKTTNQTDLRREQDNCILLLRRTHSSGIDVCLIGRNTLVLTTNALQS